MARNKHETVKSIAEAKLPSTVAGMADVVAPVKLPLLWKVSGIHGHAERVVEAASEDEAWTAFMLAEGLLASAHRPVIQRVEVADAIA